MKKETYERLSMDVTTIDVKDVITTSDVAPAGFNPDNPWEMPNEP
jgi:hypothetical protein